MSLSRMASLGAVSFCLTSATMGSQWLHNKMQSLLDSRIDAYEQAYACMDQVKKDLEAASYANYLSVENMHKALDQLSEDPNATADQLEAIQQELNHSRKVSKDIGWRYDVVFQMRADLSRNLNELHNIKWNIDLYSNWNKFTYLFSQYPSPRAYLQQSLLDLLSDLSGAR